MFPILDQKGFEMPLYGGGGGGCLMQTKNSVYNGKNITDVLCGRSLYKTSPANQIVQEKNVIIQSLKSF